MTRKLNIKSNISNLGIVENTIDTITNEIGINQECYGKILISVLEAVNNAIVHGNKSNENKQVGISFSIIKKNMFVDICDEGPGFNPGQVPDPTRPENIELTNGRGIFLMSRLADEIEFNKKGNSVKLTFKNIVP
jgi:serine/threonine-protein kinase RsbW